MDADLKSYFDSIPHTKLMDEVRKYIGDGRVLALIATFLTQDIVEGLVLWTPEKGAPQGAVMTPRTQKVTLNSCGRFDSVKREISD